MVVGAENVHDTVSTVVLAGCSTVIVALVNANVGDPLGPLWVRAFRRARCGRLSECDALAEPPRRRRSVRRPLRGRRSGTKMSASEGAVHGPHVQGRDRATCLTACDLCRQPCKRRSFGGRTPRQSSVSTTQTRTRTRSQTRSAGEPITLDYASEFSGVFMRKQGRSRGSDTVCFRQLLGHRDVHERSER